LTGLAGFSACNRVSIARLLMMEEHFKNEKNETNYAASKSFCKMGTY
jgi:hypothetical protein